MHNKVLLRKRSGWNELYTPRYAIEPLKKYLLKGIVDLTFTKSDYGIERAPIIWCPFDTEESNYVKVFKEWGYTVIHSHIDDGKDFFNYAPEEYDYIISNPPFSIKTKILKRLYELGKNFAMLLPLTSLEGIERNKMYKKYGLKLIILDKRVSFFQGNNSNYFNTSYFCSNDFMNANFNNQQIVFETLDKESIKKEKHQKTHQYYKDLRKENE